MAKLRLLKRFNRQVPGDIVEIAKEADAKVLRLLGIAEDFVEGRRGRTTTRDMHPEQTTTTIQQSSASEPTQPPAPQEQTSASHPVPAMSTEENKDTPPSPTQDGGNGDGFGSDRYSRRDMQPKE